jgi:uncharacterized protein YbaR (Trm112 family)
VFALDILACPDCGGRLPLLAPIEDRAVIEKILAHLRVARRSAAALGRAQPAWLPGVRDRPITSAGSLAPASDST